MKRGVRDLLSFLADVQKDMEWCVKAREAMAKGADDLCSKLESDSDDVTKLAEAHKYLADFQSALSEMKHTLEHQILVTEIRQRCEFETLMFSQRIASIAGTQLAVAASLAEDVVGPVKATISLANTLAKDFFDPALREAEAAEEIVPTMLQAAKKVRSPKGADVQTILVDILRFKSELQELASDLKRSPILDHLKAIESYMTDAKPIMELFDV